jgi:hypothetical protein
VQPWAVVTALAFTLATVLALAWPAGGLKEAVTETPHRRMGDRTTGHRLAIKPYALRYATKDPAPAFGDAKPGRFLAMELEVTNVSDRTATVGDLSLQLYLTVSPGGAAIDRIADKSAGFVVRDGRTDRDQLQPGLTERVVIVYTLPARVPDPTDVAVTFRDREWVGGFESRLPDWYETGDLAVYDLKVAR